MIFTGDIIYSKPALENMRNVLKTVSDRKIPFSIFFGNHDNEDVYKRQHHIHENKKQGEIEEVEWQKGLNKIAHNKGGYFIQIDLSATPLSLIHI